MKALATLFPRFKRDWLWNTYVAFVCVRFSRSLVSDLLWYADPLRSSTLILLLSEVLWIAWLLHPWVEVEEVQE